MLKIHPRYIAQVNACARVEDLYPVLQQAIELEHATIPPYLTAYYSIRPGINGEIAELIRSVLIEEMLHMTIAANILVSLGGSPAINKSEFVPSYPGPLPLGIGGHDFTVHIKAFSLDVVRDTFMAIEEPEEPIPIGRLDASPTSSAEISYNTIGEFYAAIRAKLENLPGSDFGHADRQVDLFKEPFFPINSAQDACAGIDLIVRQGEGSSTDPFESPGEPAHFYRFGEIYYGSRLMSVDKAGKKFKYGADPVAFVASGVFPMKADPTPDQFPENSYGRTLTDAFIEGYSHLLNCLHAAFNGSPSEIHAGISLMYELRFLAQKLMDTPLREGGVETGGPVFVYRRS